MRLQLDLRKSQAGFIASVVMLALLALGLYVGYQFGIPYYRYSAFKSDVKEIARVSLGDVDKTRKMVLESAESYKLPIEESDILVTKKQNTVRVVTQWSTDVDILGLYQKRLNFSVDVEE